MPKIIRERLTELKHDQKHNVEKLTKKQKQEISYIVLREMDELEDLINIALRNLIGPKASQEALVYAREVFYKG